jgi:asparagine synthase (glutamine-hydrolysing)
MTTAKRRADLPPRIAGCWLKQGPLPAPTIEWSRQIEPDSPADGGASALWIGGANLSRTHDAEGEVYVAIAGYPKWKIAELADVARQRGLAQSLLAGYRQKGLDVFNSLSGPFACAIDDRRAGQLILAIDRFGIGRLCVAPVGGGVLFAASAEGLSHHPAVGGKLSADAIYQYLFFQMIPSPLTAFEGVQKLPPGHYGIANERGWRMERYWNPQFNDREREEDGLDKALHAALREAVRRSDADRETGAFLSGGLDSSSVTGALREVIGAPIRSFSIGFRAEGFDEIEYARIAARRFEVDAHEYYVSPADVREAAPLIAAAYDEPFGNASAVPVYFCAREAAAKGVSRLLAGDGGDELFGGNSRYGKQTVFAAYDSLPQWVRRAIMEPLFYRKDISDGTPWPLRKAQRYVQQARMPMPDRLESYNLFCLRPLPTMLSADFRARIDTESPWQSLRSAWGSTSARSMTNHMLWLDWKMTLADNDLRKVETMCALAGVEVRYPMLDDEITDLSLRLTSKQKVRGTLLRPFFKDAMRGWLPDATIDKSKHGFGLPFGIWMAEDAALKALALQSLKSLRGRGILEPAFIDDLIERHGADHATYYGTFIWVLMMLELWVAARSRPGPLW